jgi:hypothetical protein
VEYVPKEKPLKGAKAAKADKQTKLKPPSKQHGRPAVDLPPGAKCVAVDAGLRNMCGVAREDDCDLKKQKFKNGKHPIGQGRGAWTYSTKQFRQETGSKPRAREEEALLRRRKVQDPALKQALDAVAAANTKTADVARLAAAVRERGAAWPKIYSFFGSQRHSRLKFANRMGEHSVLDRLVYEIAPNQTDHVIVGDANFGSTVRGLPPGAAGKLIRRLQEKLPGRVHFACEFRSSMLDCITHKPMAHPWGPSAW